MSGHAKRMFDKYYITVKSDLNKYILNLIPMLPYNYDINTIITLLEEYYPHELFVINERYEYYRIKEKHILKYKMASRYKLKNIYQIINDLHIYRKIMKPDYFKNHKIKYNEYSLLEYKKVFKEKREKSINKIYDKINQAKLKTQQMEPEFLDILMGLYDRKNTTQKDKVYIMYELKKYYCPKIIKFFSKKNDTEYNFQLREMAFKHLQSFGFQPVLIGQKDITIRNDNKVKKESIKRYGKERYDIKAIPEELEYQINNSKDQKIKSYDIFISHSSQDADSVQKLILHLNSINKNIYCDWINDNDYLKRELVGEATLKVIIKRASQSRECVFVISPNSMQSKWCKYELNEFFNISKSIYFITKEQIDNGIFDYSKYNDEWFIDPNYKEMQLFSTQINLTE